MKDLANPNLFLFANMCIWVCVICLTRKNYIYIIKLVNIWHTTFVDQIGVKMGKFFKVFGYVFLGLFILVLGVVGYLYFSGSFDDNRIELDTIAFEVNSDEIDNMESMIVDGKETLIVTGDIQMTIGFTPSDATSKTINLKVKSGQDFVQVPSQVIAGEPFTITIDKANPNYGGTVVITATDVKGQTKVNQDLVFVVDRPVEDLQLFNFEGNVSESEDSVILAFSNDNLAFELQSTPLNAINPNLASSEFDTSKFFKNIKVESSDPSVMEVIPNSETPYTIDIEKNSAILNYYIKTVGKGNAELTATMFPTYLMDVDYTATNFEKFLAGDSAYNTFSTVANACADFVTKYQDYIKAVKDPISMPSLDREMNGEELINELTHNGTTEISFITDNRGSDVFKDVLQFLQVKKTIDVGVVMGTVESISVTTNEIQWILHKDNSEQPYTINSLVQDFGLKINPENDNNNLDSLLSSIKINALLVNTADKTFTFENYENDTELQTLIDLLNDPNTNRSTGTDGRSSIFPDFVVTNDPANYTKDGYMHYEKKDYTNDHSEILANAIFDIKEEIRNGEKVWVLTSYNQIPDNVDLYLHFSLSTIMSNDGENIDVVYETVVKVTMDSNTTPVDSNIQIQTSLPNMMVTNENGVSYNGSVLYNNYTSQVDYAKLVSSEGITDFSYTTIRYLVKQSEVQKIELNGETPCIDVVKDEEGNIVTHTLSDGETYFEVNNSRNGVLNLQATNISPYEVDPSKVYTNTYVYCVVIKTDREGNPIYAQDGSYIQVAMKKSSDSFVVRSFVDNLYYYSAVDTKEGQTTKTTYILRNYNISGDRLVNYPITSGDTTTNALILLNDTTHTATLFNDQGGDDFDYDEVVAYVTDNPNSLVIEIDKNVNPIINEDMEFVVLNYIIYSDGTMYLADESLAESQAVKYRSALDDEWSSLQFEPGVSGVSQEDLGTYVQTIATRENREDLPFKSYISLSVQALQNAQIDIRTIGTVNNINDSLYLYPFYLDYDKSNEAINLFGFAHPEATQEQYYTYAFSDNYIGGDYGEDVSNILELSAKSNGSNIIWLQKDSTVDPNTLTKSIDFMTFAKDDLTFYGPIKYQLDTSSTDVAQQQNLDTYLQNFANNTVSDWQLSYYVAQSSNVDLSNVSWQSASMSNNPYLTISKGTDNNYHMNIQQGSQNGVYIKLSVVLYNYALPNGVDGNYVFEDTNYQIAKTFTTYIVLYQDEPVITLYSEFGGADGDILNGGSADKGQYRMAQAGTQVPLVGTVDGLSSPRDYIVVTLSDKSIISSAKMNINASDRSKIVFGACYGAGNTTNVTRTYEIDGTQILNGLCLYVYDSGIDTSATFTVTVAGKTEIYYVSISKNVDISINSSSTSSTGEYTVSNTNNDYFELDVKDSGLSSTPNRYALNEIFSMRKTSDWSTINISFDFVDQDSGSNEFYKLGNVGNSQYLYVGRIYSPITFDLNILYKFSDEALENTTYYKLIRVTINPSISITLEGSDTFDSQNPKIVVTGENCNLFDTSSDYYIAGTYNGAPLSTNQIVDFATVSLDRNTISTDDLNELGGLALSSDRTSITTSFTIKTVKNVRFIVQFIQASVTLDDAGARLSNSGVLNVDMYMYFTFQPEVDFVAKNNDASPNSEETPYELKDSNISSVGTHSSITLYDSSLDDNLITFTARHNNINTDITLSAISSANIYKKVLTSDGITYKWELVDDNEYFDVETDGSKVILKKLTSVNEDTEFKITFVNDFSNEANYYVKLYSDVLVRSNYPILQDGEKVPVGQSIDLLQGYAFASKRIEVYSAIDGVDITRDFAKTYQVYSDSNLTSLVDTAVAEVSAQGKLYVKANTYSDLYVKVTLSCGSYTVYHIVVVDSGLNSGLINSTQTVKANHEYNLQELLGNAKYALKLNDDQTTTKVEGDTYVFEEKYSAEKYNVTFYIYNDNSVQNEGTKIITFQVEMNVSIVRNESADSLAATEEYTLYNDGVQSNYVLSLIKSDGSNESIDGSQFTYTANDSNVVISGNTIKYNKDISTDVKVTVSVRHNDNVLGTINVTFVPNINNLILDSLYNNTSNASYRVVSPLQGTGLINVSTYSSPTNFDGTESYTTGVTYSIDGVTPQGVSIDGSGNITYPIVNNIISFRVKATIAWGDVEYSEYITIYVEPNIDTNSVVTPTIVVNAGDTMALNAVLSGDMITLDNNNLFRVKNSNGTSPIVIRFKDVTTVDYSITNNQLVVYNTSNSNPIKIAYSVDFVGNSNIADCYTNDVLYFYIQIANAIDDIEIVGDNSSITLTGNAQVLNDILIIRDNTSAQWYHSIYVTDQNGQVLSGAKIVNTDTQTKLIFATNSSENRNVVVRLYPYSGATQYVTIEFVIPATTIPQSTEISVNKSEGTQIDLSEKFSYAFDKAIFDYAFEGASPSNEIKESNLSGSVLDISAATSTTVVTIKVSDGLNEFRIVLTISVG